MVMTMPDHLRYAGIGDAAQRAALASIVRGNALLMNVLETLRSSGLPDALVASGAVYNSVWNVLTGRPPLTGIKDIDVVYFDDSDLSWDAEDAVIRRMQALFADSPVPVEIRNQARVHIWFPEKFGVAYPRLTCSEDMLLYFASKTHAVALRLEKNGALHIAAPFGLDDMFSFRITPNHRLDNSATHTTKAERAQGIWPELTVVPW
jgi:hypothetical protein